MTGIRVTGHGCTFTNFIMEDFKIGMEILGDDTQVIDVEIR